MAQRTYRNRVVRVADLAVGESMPLTGYHFAACELRGPAIVHLYGETVLDGCSWDTEGHGVEAILWEIDPGRGPVVIGAIGFYDSTFTDCVFKGIGVAGPHDLLTKFLGDSTV